METKVLLVYPEIPPTYWSLKYVLPFIGKKAIFPPLGLLTVAAMLPADWSLSLVDMNVESLREAAVAQADLVFVSAMIVQKDSLERVIQLCHKLGKPIVAGGPYPTSCHSQIRGVDHFVLNEAESTLPAFVRDFERGQARPVYTSTDRPDLSLTPPPRFDLVRRADYAEMALQYSRGCPYDCEFCDIIELFGRRPRVKTPAQLLQEMELLHQLGWRGPLFLVDDNFIGNRKEVRALLPELARWQRERRYPFSLFTEASLDLAEDEPLMAEMVKAGFNMVFMGIETPDLCTLKATAKPQNLKGDLLASVRKIQRAGLEVAGGFIVGFDSDADDIFERQVRFIQEAAIPTAMVGLLTALPGTRLHRRLQAEDRLTAESGGGNNTHDLRLNFLPKMDPRRLIEGYKRILAEIYAPNRYFERCFRLLTSLKGHRTSSRKIRLTELRAFALSLAIQTFSRYAPSYWRFIIRGFLARPRMAPETITMAIKGHHFFKMTRGVLELDRFQVALSGLERAFADRVRASAASGRTGRFDELKAYRDQLLVQVSRLYRKVPRDFREAAGGAVDAFRASIDGFLAGLVTQAPVSGTSLS